MRMLSGAVVVLAGAVLAGLSIMAVQFSSRTDTDVAMWGLMGGAALGVVGLAVVILGGTDRDGRPPTF